ncbi:MAG: HAD-IC family P-type ATPase [Sphingomonas bacterium]|nr:HAD-IC family P-type ATPase [Sphingomonas bacterium]
MKMSDGAPVWHAWPIAEVVEHLGSATDGLSTAEAQQRLAKAGPNAIASAPAPAFVRVFAYQFLSPLIYLLLAAAVVAVVMAEYVEAGFILIVLMVNAAIGATQEFRASASADALRRMIEQKASVRRDGAVATIAAEDVVQGDIVLLESGMRVPADLRLIATAGLIVDESLLTGESVAVDKDSAATIASDASTGDRSTLAHAGTIVTKGRGTGVVVAVGNNTALGAIAGALDTAPETPSPLILQMNRLSRHIAIATVAIVILFGLVLALQGSSLDEIFILAVALAVSAIPGGLPIAVTVALAAASKRMATRNVIVRTLPAVEGLGACTIIATDKTGTLTQNRLAVEQVLLPDRRTVESSAWRAGVKQGDADQDEALTALAISGALGNEASDGPDGPTGDAVDVALIEFAKELGLDLATLRDSANCVRRQAYEPELKMAWAVYRTDGKTAFHVKGAVETVLPMCVDGSPDIHADAVRLAAAGLRVLAVARGVADDAAASSAQPSNLTLCGLVALSDPVRPEVPAAIAACKTAGVEVRMVTGDHPATALAIARSLGIAEDEREVATGAQIAALSGNALRDRLASASVLARFEPAQKLALVEALERGGHLVAVTGDGVNDAPALKTAHIGVAMGKSGTDVARGVADLVLTDDNFASIVGGIEEGRNTYDNVRRIVIVLVGTGLSEVAMFAAALMLGVPMPLTAVQLLWLNVVTNGLQDVMLGFERGTGDALDRPPRPPRQPLLDRTALMMLIPPALYMAATAIGLFAWRLDAGASVEQARNFVLFTTVLFQNAYVLSMRSERTSIFRMSLFGNPWLLAGISGALLLQLVAQYLPIAATVLGTAPLAALEYGTALIAALGLVVVTEVNKFLLGRGQKGMTA